MLWPMFFSVTLCKGTHVVDPLTYINCLNILTDYLHPFLSPLIRLMIPSYRKFHSRLGLKFSNCPPNFPDLNSTEHLKDVLEKVQSMGALPLHATSHI